MTDRAVLRDVSASIIGSSLPSCGHVTASEYQPFTFIRLVPVLPL